MGKGCYKITDRELLELIASQVGTLTSEVDGLKSELKTIHTKLDEKADKTDIVRFENSVNPKITSLYDGYKQNTEQLNRIEEKVNKHEDFIIRKVK